MTAPSASGQARRVSVASRLKRAPASWVAVFAVLAMGIILRFVFLNSDPAYYAWAGYVTDEGRWTAQARELVLFGSPDLRYWLAFVHLVVSPLYEAVTWVSFSLFGVGFASARLVSAVSGALLLVAMWLLLRRRLSAEGLLVALVAVALQGDLVFLSRVAVPEMVATLFEFLAFAVLLSRPQSARRALVAGLVTALGLGFKGTDFVIVPILGAVSWFVGRREPVPRRLRLIGAYLVGVALPAVVVGTAIVALTDLNLVGRLEQAWPTLRSFLQPSAAYGAASFLFNGDYTVALNSFLLGAWVIAALLLGVGEIPEGTAKDIYIGTAVWSVGWLAIAAGLSYFPERYIFHGLVPLAMNVGAGLTLLRQVGASKIASSFRHLEGPKGWFTAICMSLPIAVLLCPVVIPLFSYLGPVERLSQRVLLIAVLTLSVAGAAVWSSGRSPRIVLHVLCGLPPIVALLWLVGRDLGIVQRSFWPTPGGTGSWAWIALFVAAGVAAWLLRDAYTGRASTAVSVSAPVTLLAVGLATVGLLQSGPNLIHPTYTLMDAGRALQATFGEGDQEIGSLLASSIFLPTTLPYVEGFDYRPGLGNQMPDVVVNAFHYPPVLTATYYLSEQYPIRMGREYVEHHRDEPVLRIFRRRR